jgi:Holliday junction DNA helicase RuvA
MIARLTGTLLEKHPGQLVVNVGGVGYDVAVPLGTYRGLGEPGSRVDLHVHMHVREDTLALFGFLTRLEKDLFIRLIGVNGVGPKLAVAILSGLGAEDLIAAVRGRDAGRLASVPGVGRKTAERVLLEIGGRIDALAGAAAGGAASLDAGAAEVRRDLVSALVNLGYNARVASEAADRALLDRRAGETPVFEVILRSTLKSLAR